MKIKHFIPYFFLALLLTPIFTSVLPFASVSAQQALTGQWIDKVSINVNGQVFKDKNPFDGTDNYKFNVGQNCDSSLDVSSLSSSGKSGQIQFKKMGSIEGECVNNGPKQPITLTNEQARFVTAYKTADDTIFLPAYITGNVNSGLGGGNFGAGSSSELNGLFKLWPKDATEYDPDKFPHIEGNQYDNFDGAGGAQVYFSEKKLKAQVCEGHFGCKSDEYGLKFAANGAITQPDQSIYGAAIQKGTQGTTGPGAKDNSCESHGAMAWILCPVIDILNSVFNWLDTQIQALLEVNKDAYTNPKLYQAWSNIRDIAFIVLIPIMLVMVIGTALGSELLSAYTVKKAIPRMVAAIIFITLSWYICGFLIAFSNVVGSGVLGLITSPFHLGGSITLTDLFTPSYGGFAVQGATLAVGIIAVVAIDGLLGILVSYFFVAVLFLFVAFLVLTLRQMMVLGLLLAAPLAILAWIFPGNDKVWKLWWSSFSKLLIMFPLITGLIAMGRVFAYLIGNTPAAGLQGGLLNPLLKITAYILPYALIPLTFKFAGGAFATLTGAMSDRSRGVFDRLKKGRQTKFGQMGSNLKGGKLLRVRGDEHSRTSRLNQKLQTATLVGAAGFSMNRGQRSARIEAVRSQREMLQAKELMEKEESMQPIVKDDDKLWAVMHGTNEAEMRQILKDRAPGRFNETDKKLDLDRAVEEAMRFRKRAGHNASRVAATIANAATGTGYNYRQDAQGNFIGDDDMMTAILDSAGGDASLAGRMLAEMRPMAVQSGRQDIAGGGYAQSMKIMSDMRKARTAPGGVITRDMIDPTTGETLRDAAGNVRTITGAYTVDEARLDIMQDVLRSNAGAAVAGKVKGVKQLAPVLKANAQAALQATGANATKDAARELATLAGKHDAASQIAPQNARALADGVLDQSIDVGTLSTEMRAMLAPALLRVNPVDGSQYSVTSGNITYQQAIEALRGNADFQTMRREYQSSSIAAAQQQNAAALAGQQGIQPPVPPPVAQT